MKFFKKTAAAWIIAALFLCVMMPMHAESDDQVVVMIDPGHGGYDGGTVAADSETLEKDLTLMYAKKIGAQIEKLDSSIEVLYTRNSDKVSWARDDEDADLKRRVIIAKKRHADYFLSIHMNSSEDTSMEGYAAFVRPKDKASKKIYKIIAKNLKKAGYEADNGLTTTDQYPLYVVSKQKIPAMLFEVGYISNSTELKQLKKKKVVKAYAKAIAAAYVQYIHQNN